MIYYGWITTEGKEDSSMLPVINRQLLESHLGVGPYEQGGNCKLKYFLLKSRDTFPLNETACRKFQRPIRGPVFYVGKNTTIVGL